MNSYKIPFPGFGRYNRYDDESGPAEQDCTDDSLQEYRDDKDDTLDESFVNE